LKSHHRSQHSPNSGPWYSWKKQIVHMDINKQCYLKNTIIGKIESKTQPFSLTEIPPPQISRPKP
jgi:hypothetical protein